jgi:hypothetical protein
MRGVLPDRKKASGIGCTGNKSEIARQVPIRGVCSLTASQPSQIEERHASMIAVVHAARHYLSLHALTKQGQQNLGSYPGMLAASMRRPVCVNASDLSVVGQFEISWFSVCRGGGGNTGAEIRVETRAQPIFGCVKSCHAVRNCANGYARQGYVQASETIGRPVWIAMKIHSYDEGAHRAGNEGTKKNQDTRPFRGHSVMLSRAKDNFKLTHYRFVQEELFTIVYPSSMRRR